MAPEDDFKSLREKYWAIRGAELAEAVNAVKQLAEANPADIQEIAAAQINIGTQYYRAALSQAQRSFSWALVASVTGTALFVIGIGALFVSSSHRLDISVLSGVGGGLSQLIAALNFWLYNRTSQQLASFLLHLDQMQRFLLANSVCESLTGDERARSKAELVRLIAAPVRGQVAPKADRPAAMAKS